MDYEPEVWDEENESMDVENLPPGDTEQQELLIQQRIVLDPTGWEGHRP